MAKLTKTLVLQQRIYMASLQETASQIRRDIVRMVHAVQSGHPGGSLGCTDFLTALYFKTMKHHPSFNMDATNEDVFFYQTDIFLLFFIPVLPAQATFL